MYQQLARNSNTQIRIMHIIDLDLLTMCFLFIGALGSVVLKRGIATAETYIPIHLEHNHVQLLEGSGVG